MSSIELRQLRAFGRQVSGEIVEIPRELWLLRGIDETLEALDLETEKFRQMRYAAERYVEQVKHVQPLAADELDELVTLFEQARDNVGRFYDEHCAKRQAVIDDDRLNEEDGVVVGYDLLLAEAAALHNCLNELAWALGEHSADFDQRANEAHQTAASLFASLGV